LNGSGDYGVVSRFGAHMLLHVDNRQLAAMDRGIGPFALDGGAPVYRLFA
jgi:hypothetical protein